MKRRLLLAGCVLLVLGVVGSGALAAPPGSGSCAGGAIPAGTYNGLKVTGNCTFGGDVTVNGNLTVADGAILNDHAASTAKVHVAGNVLVGKGAVLGLGDYNPVGPHGSTVDGNVVANNPLTLYIGAVTIRGNLVSSGGGDPGRNFPIKDDTIGGNLIIQGWHGLWLGVIRAQVGGNVIVSNNSAADTSALPGSDSTEVQTNVISGNLICQGNSPAAQVNPDDGGQPNVVGGHKIGQCAGL